MLSLVLSTAEFFCAKVVFSDTITYLDHFHAAAVGTAISLSSVTMLPIILKQWQ